MYITVSSTHAVRIPGEFSALPEMMFRDVKLFKTVLVSKEIEFHS